VLDIECKAAKRFEAKALATVSGLKVKVGTAFLSRTKSKTQIIFFLSYCPR
jgi:hypothetical protein